MGCVLCTDVFAKGTSEMDILSRIASIAASNDSYDISLPVVRKTVLKREKRYHHLGIPLSQGEEYTREYSYTQLASSLILADGRQLHSERISRAYMRVYRNNTTTCMLIVNTHDRVEWQFPNQNIQKIVGQMVF